VGYDYSFEDALITYVVKKWDSKIELGRTVMQKLCYFLKAKGVPINYSFEMYHYGPYSQELYFRLDELKTYGIIKDVSETSNRSVYAPGDKDSKVLDKYSELLKKYESDIDSILNLFDDFRPADLELLATIHYFKTSYTKFHKKNVDVDKKFVISKVKEAKNNKFDDLLISKAYDALEAAGLFEWNNI